MPVSMPDAPTLTALTELDLDAEGDISVVAGIAAARRAIQTCSGYRF
ncbi:hypothetical protein SV7mr_51680 [Stieleria bergensis]|uniref:Uncharacterized protein n=1 Tax=Stieleria bergensis TaxID=2528025 RepID=A0A517T2L4_9BACT|nr:hypothetical protein SV7mr_51680 [Planctomycetes bacterium SV_7m_r]